MDARNENRIRNRTVFGITAVAVVAIAASAAVVLHGSGQPGASQVALSAGTSAANSSAANSSAGYQFLTLNDTRDDTFNQVLGINNSGIIAGYFGSGTKGHANKGYEIHAPYAQADFTNENFPGSVQTQITGLNDFGTSVGFYSTQNTASNANDNFGFVDLGGHYLKVEFPTGDNSNPPVDQLLGVNNVGVAVGFYTNGQGSDRGFEYDIAIRQFIRVLVPGAPSGVKGPSLTAAAINNHGDVAGFYNKNANTVVSFLRLRDGKFTTFAYPGATSTNATGVNDSDEVAGTYTLGSGSSATQHGFIWSGGKFTTIDDPAGAGSTNINGINNEGDLVGFYTNAKGDTEGLFALP
jgi:hypothetical protein